MDMVAETELNTAQSVQPAVPARAGAGGRARRYRSGELFAGAREIVIEHVGEEYRLRITQLGKLILTK